MTELLTAAQMRALEQAAIESGKVTGLELMERAGRGVVEAVFSEWPELAAKPHRAVILCGPGNNGGDGFVVARLLHDRGWEVDVSLFGNAKKLPPDAKANYDRWCALGEVGTWPKGSAIKADICIDALFGTGLSRPLDAFHDILDAIYEAQEDIFCGPGCPSIDRTVAVDIPSGLCADSGRILGFYKDDEGPRLRADLTVTFHSKKLGHVLEDGPYLCGKVAVADIGLRTLLHERETVVHQKHYVNKSELWKYPYDHKYTHGHALILAGRAGKGGAARLAARGALRVGAGLVTVAPTPGALQENAARLDAIMLSPVGEAQALAAVLADTRLNALCLGPGLGLERARDLVPVALEAKRATVLDADALTAFADDPQVLFDMLHDACVLTPHAGEFARLFPDLADKLRAPATTGPAWSKVDATRDAAARAGCTVVFKGPDTVIAGPDGRCSVHAAAYDRSAPWLATAGSGDVLAGIITGLLARGRRPLEAAGTGAWLHVECARAFGPGLIAEDLPEQLPAVLRRLTG